LLLLAPLLAACAESEVFDLQVTRVRLLRNQRGDLHIDAAGVTFRSSDGKTTVTIPMQDLREADVADPHALRFETYEVQKWKPIERREFAFRAGPDAPVEELAQFLAARVHRPVLGHYSAASEFQVAAYHRQMLGGTDGTLEIGEESIRFVSDKAADSRTWLYRDIETIGKPDSFRFRVTTSRETYILELKTELPEEAYQFAWSKVYKLERSGTDRGPAPKRASRRVSMRRGAQRRTKMNRWGRPTGLLADALVGLCEPAQEAGQGPAADQGVRPTIFEGVSTPQTRVSAPRTPGMGTMVNILI
jgi:hypothetical protein